MIRAINTNIHYINNYVQFIIYITILILNTFY